MRVVYTFLCWHALLQLGCQPAAPPPELIGVWRTDAPAYRDRPLEIQPGWVVFGTGGRASSSFARDGADYELRDDGSVLCTLFYRSADGSRTHLRLVFAEGPPESLRFENRPEVWLREDSAPNSGQRT